MKQSITDQMHFTKRSGFALLLLLASISLLLKESHSICQENFMEFGTQITAIHASANNRYVAIGFSDGKVKIYSAYNYNLLTEYSASSSITALSFSGDGKFLAIGTSGSQNVPVLHGYYPFTLNTTLTTNVGSTINDLDFSRSSDQFIACGSPGTSNGVVTIFTVAGWTLLGSQPITPTSNTPFSCKFSATTTYAVSNSNRVETFANNVKITNIGNGPIKFHRFEYKPSGDRFVYIDTQFDRFYEYIVATDTHNQLSGVSGVLRDVDYSASGYSAVGGEDKKIFIFDGSNSNQLVSTWESPDKVSALSFNTDLIIPKLYIGDQSGNLLVIGANCTNGCGPEYFYDNDTCYYCGSYIDNCINCVSETVCDFCVQGYYVDPSTYQCTICSIVGCLTCYDSSDCEECQLGYYVSSTFPRVCKRCSESPSLGAGCTMCLSETVCTLCTNGYYLDTGTNTCVFYRQIPNCLRYASTTNCLQCETGFFSTTTACVPCDTDCLECQLASTNCTQCVKGFYVDPPNGLFTCTPCQSNCLSCNSTDFCFECENSMYEKVDGTCEQCTYPCISCEDASTCHGCLQGYFLSGTTCTRCPQNCASCMSLLLCESCSTGYYLDGFNVCHLCSDTYPNCELCSSTNCEYCQMNYYLNSSNQCEYCVDEMFKCEQCSSATNCVSCVTGYFHTGLIANASCAACKAGCQTCIDSDDCSKCYKQYYLDVNLNCTPCENNCLQCSDQITCEICDTGYYLDLGTCKLCKENIPGCLECADGLTCLNCEISFYLDSTDDLCKSCALNCLTCDQTDCFTCHLGYFLTTVAPKACQICPQSCTECSSATVCSSCISGYWLDGTDCKDCSVERNCQKCNSTSCHSCENGYYLDNSVNPAEYECTSCLVVMRGCLSCNESAHCFSCSDGYYLDGVSFLCEPCSDSLTGCLECSDQTTCTKCYSGLYLDSGTDTCEHCPVGCSSCNPSGDCFSCVAGYYLSGTNCVDCGVTLGGCDLCTNSSECIQCQNGYYLDISGANDLCAMCRSAMVGCMFCDDVTTCKKCQPGYFLNTGTDKCEQCSTSIQGCEMCNTSAICTDCGVGYFLTTGHGCSLCSSSLTGCVNCLDLSTCSECITGFVLMGTNTCASCSSQNSGCSNCVMPGGVLQCNTCEAGFYLDSVSVLCEPCLIDGCEICSESNPSQCVSCNSAFYFDLGSSTCIKCDTAMTGCGHCSSPSVCLDCDSGYHLDTVHNNCTLCQESLTGCSKCEYDSTPTLVCTQCKSIYLLNSGVCGACAEVLEGCSYCTNSTECVSCSNGYFKNSSSLVCDLCSVVPGCLLCLDEHTCQYCSADYYLNASSSTCVKCSDVLPNCITCFSDVVCTSCESGYFLNDNDQCEFLEVKEMVYIEELKFVTTYVDQDTLSHILYARKDLVFEQQGYDLSEGIELFITDYTELSSNSIITQSPMTIKSIEWLSSTAIKILTDNPTKITEQEMSVTRRLLTSSSIHANYKVNLEIDEDTVDAIMPSLYVVGDIIVDYSLDEPQFYISYMKSRSDSGTAYNAFGYAVMTLVVLFCCFKVYRLLLKDEALLNHHLTGECISHFAALRCVSLTLYPVTFEMYHLSYGFLLFDFPWINESLGDWMADQSEDLPDALALYYQNLSIICTFGVSLIVFLGLLAMIRLLIKKKNAFARTKYSCLVYNIFIFGIVYNGSLSIQGALYNPLNKVTLNAVFYLVGILMYICAFTEILHSVYHSRNQLYKLRILIKATLLSVAHINPISIFSATLLTDVLLIVVQYFVVEHENDGFSCHWAFVQTVLDVALGILFMYPNTELGIGLFMTLTCVALLAQGYLSCCLLSRKGKNKSHSFYSTNRVKNSSDRVQKSMIEKESHRDDSFQTINQTGKEKAYDIWNNDGFNEQFIDDVFQQSKKISQKERNNSNSRRQEQPEVIPAKLATNRRQKTNRVKGVRKQDSNSKLYVKSLQQPEEDDFEEPNLSPNKRSRADPVLRE